MECNKPAYNKGQFFGVSVTRKSVKTNWLYRYLELSHWWNYLTKSKNLSEKESSK